GDARRVLRDVAARIAEADAPLDRAQRLGERVDVRCVRLEDVEGHTLRGLGADARQPAELLHQILQGALVEQAHSRVSSMITPPSMRSTTAGPYSSSCSMSASPSVS